jgi:glycosyltransferase involved in cell wall biosynthesis
VDAVDDLVTGTLVPPHDPAALAKALGAYLERPELRSRHGQAGRRRVSDEFRPEVVWGALLDEYRDLLGRRESGSVSAKGP